MDSYRCKLLGMPLLPKWEYATMFSGRFFAPSSLNKPAGHERSMGTQNVGFPIANITVLIQHLLKAMGAGCSHRWAAAFYTTKVSK